MHDLEIAPDDPSAPDVAALLGRHLAFAVEVTPPGDVHALDEQGLRHPSITLLGARLSGELVGVGALKDLGEGHAEVKSMHTAEAVRGRGVARAILDRLLDVARERGCTRVSLETGAMEAFAPARALYTSAGFEPCEPFGTYVAGRNSICMTIRLPGG